MSSINWIQVLSKHDTDGDDCINYNEWLSFCESNNINNKDEIWTQLSSGITHHGSKLKIKDIASILNETKV